MEHTATYSPEDNKLRLYPAHRLDADEYAKVKAAGFAWAPKQELFVAPAWTPAREDLLLSMCPDGIGDEDTSLVERAEERAERFEDYSAKREKDAERAHAAVSSIADGIPMGQPILVGHHSEKHARRDAEKIENGMRRAVNAWKTAKYWEQRAAGALAHAKYKELPGVRARRIKGLEAERRKIERAEAKREACRKIWERVQTLADARIVCDRTEAGWLSTAKHPSLDQYLHPSDVLPFEDRDEYKRTTYPTWTLEQVKERAAVVYAPPGPEHHSTRWLEHLDNRLAYENAMLAESGGLASDRFKFRPGGQVLRRGSWYVVLKVNPQSVTVSGHFATTISFDEISDYREATDEAAAAVRKVMKLPPLCNYPGEGFRHMTKAELAADKSRRWSDFPKTGRRGPTEKYGAHRVQQVRGAKAFDVVGVYITDQKRTDPPPPATEPRPDLKPKKAERAPSPYVRPEPSKFEAMADSLKAGVQVVSAPNLFPTPVDVAGRVAAYADIRAGDRILEPSAGTGRLLDAIEAGPHGEVVAVEVAYSLAEDLRRRYPCVEVRCSDFLSTNGDIGTFDRVVMNPPFDHGADIKHVRHALEHLRPGGRLVAIVANGPKQREAFENEAEHWEDLEAGTFAGTNVRAAVVVLVKPSGIPG